MAFITSSQMEDVINSLNSQSKEKNISWKREISPNMTRLGTNIKISGNRHTFNKQKMWGSQAENDQKNRKSKKEEFRDTTVYFSMVISTEV